MKKIKFLMVMLVSIMTINQARAALRSDWELVTTTAQLTSGGTFIFAYCSGSPTSTFTVVPMRNETSATTDVNGYMYSGATAGSTTSGTIDMEDGTLDTSPYEVTIETGNANGSISIKLKSGTYKDYYIKFSGTSNHNLRVTTTKNNDASFTPTYSSSRWQLLCVGRSSRYLRYWTNSSNYRFTNAAKNSGGAQWLVIYKKTGKTYHEWNGSSSFSTSAGGATLKEVPSLCDWAIEPYGWCSEENYASSSYPTSKIWFENASWPDGKTDLYALYRVGNNPYYYSTKPSIYTVTYNLTNVSKDDSYSYVCTSNIVNQVGTNFIEAYFEPASGYMLDESCISITMGGSPVSSSNYDWDPDYSYPDYDYTAQLFMENITGNVVVTVTAKVDCANSVTVATGSPTNCTISASAASVLTCSGSRQVTISVTPNSCYAAPVKASVTSTGTTATWVSGPTLNSGHYDYVYSFAENATGTTTFNCSLSTKTTYTVSYAAGATTCTGSNAISGSHANDTKTCGTGLTLPGATFTTTGYTQTGWSKTSCGSQYAAVGGSYTDNAAQTFYPVWTPNNYTVTWMVNGEAYTTGTPSDNANYGTKVTTLPTAPTPPCGDVFVGWSTTNIGSTGLDKDDDAAAITALNLFTTPAGSPTITGNTVFYAVFADYDD